MEVYRDGGTPVITPMELTSPGVAGSIPACAAISADKAVYLIEAAGHPAPTVERNRIHSDCFENTPYISASRDESATHATFIANLKDGSIAGYKYLDFGEEEVSASLSLLVAAIEAGGTVDVYLDAPSEDEGGTKIGSVVISADFAATAAQTEEAADGTVWSWIGADMNTPVSGVRAVYFVFASESDGAICALDQFAFSQEQEQAQVPLPDGSGPSSFTPRPFAAAAVCSGKTRRPGRRSASRRRTCPRSGGCSSCRSRGNPCRPWW